MRARSATRAEAPTIALRACIQLSLPPLCTPATQAKADTGTTSYSTILTMWVNLPFGEKDSLVRFISCVRQVGAKHRRLGFVACLTLERHGARVSAALAEMRAHAYKTTRVTFQNSTKM